MREALPDRIRNILNHPTIRFVIDAMDENFDNDRIGDLYRELSSIANDVEEELGKRSRRRSRVKEASTATVDVIEDNDKILSSHGVARLLQVSPSAVISWIDSEKLDGFRTSGGHRRVKTSNLILFLKEQNMPIPAALIDTDVDISVDTRIDLNEDKAPRQQ